ncbi:MAG: ATPase, T2SS/T4P/T4SS family [Ilumatobacteraceae bacterium]
MSSTCAPPDPAVVDALCQRVADVPGEVHQIVRQHVADVAPLVHGTERDRLVAAAIARLTGLDALELLLADPDVDEVLVNRGGEVWVERHGRLTRAEPIPPSTIPVVLERVLAPLGRRLDRTDPVVDARLPDGSRVCAVISPIAVDGTAISVRRLHRRALPLDAFCTADVAEVVRAIVRGRCNVVVAGATSSGKTSLLASLLTLLPPDERVLVLEDTAELATPEAAHVVRLEARTATADGVRAVPLHELVRTALRLRPDRLVVGEVRGDEVLAMVQAMNTGHDGSWSTCHANSVDDALGRLETLVLQAAPSWPLTAVRAQLARSIDVIVQVARTSDAARRIVSIGEVVADPDRTTVRPLVDEGRVVDRLRRTRGWRS